MVVTRLRTDFVFSGARRLVSERCSAIRDNEPMTDRPWFEQVSVHNSSPSVLAITINILFTIHECLTLSGFIVCTKQQLHYRILHFYADFHTEHRTSYARLGEYNINIFYHIILLYTVYELYYYYLIRPQKSKQHTHIHIWVDGIS